VLFPKGSCCAETSSIRQCTTLTLSSEPQASAEQKQNRTLNLAHNSLSAVSILESNGAFPAGDG
ncbi:hypothetical protein ILYODFUR_038390, partial [Ilyodon furcidens]